jgi:hypothetical protein
MPFAFRGEAGMDIDTPHDHERVCAANTNP